MLDYGLSQAERELLAAGMHPRHGARGHDPVPAEDRRARPAHPADVMVLIDADMIVTRPLTELIERAAQGRVLAVEHGQEQVLRELGGLARPRPGQAPDRTSPRASWSPAASREVAWSG